MSFNLINLTPHSVNVISRDREITIEPSGVVARVRFEERPAGYAYHQGKRVPISRMVVTGIRELPKATKGVKYIVSSLVQHAAEGRDDLLTPHRTIRRGGRVIGCKHLIQL